MDVLTGKEIWWKNAEKQYNTNADSSSTGSGMVWPCGIFNYHVVEDAVILYTSLLQIVVRMILQADEL